jgi:hypothetical protein
MQKYEVRVTNGGTTKSEIITAESAKMAEMMVNGRLNKQWKVIEGNTKQA